MEVIGANGRQGAALAKSALDGRLAQRIGTIQTALQSLNAHLTAWVDYPEEDVPELSDAALTGTLALQKQELDDLIAGYGAGAVLRHGVDCVLLGRPNVGKSTLLNLLAGFDRAIVTPVAGTTRDIVEQAVQLGEIRLNLFDTAGVREVGADGDAIEAEGIRRSWKKLDEAGLVLAVFDAAQPLTESDLDIARRCQGRPALAILNKQDLAEDTEAARLQLQPYFKKVLTLCAKDASSLQPLSAAVAELLGTAKLDPRAGQLCSARQLAAATRARDALAEALRAEADGFGLDAVAVCLTDALQALCDLTGEGRGRRHHRRGVRDLLCGQINGGPRSALTRDKETYMDILGNYDVIVVGAGHAGIEAAHAGGGAGCPDRRLHADAGLHRQHALQPVHRRHGQGASGARSGRPGRPDGPGRRRHLFAEPDAQPGQRSRRTQSAGAD